jgi:hypothetical protein
MTAELGLSHAVRGRDERKVAEALVGQKLTLRWKRSSALATACR